MMVVSFYETPSFTSAEVFKITEIGLQFPLLNPVDDFHHLVVHWGREAHSSAIIRYGTIDGIHFGQFAFFQVLQHAGLQFGMLADGDRDDEEREGTLQGIRIVEQLHDVLSLHRFDADTTFLAHIDTLLD